MIGFSNIEIKDFRGIESLQLDDFARVNVFLGQNNSGKSSVLEALTLLLNMSNIDVPQFLNSIRNRSSYSNIGDIRYLFRNMDQKLIPEISAVQHDGLKRHVALRMAYVFNKNNEQNIQNGQLPSSETTYFINTLEMLFDVTENGVKKDYKSSVTFNNGIITNKKPAEGYLEKNAGVYLSPDLVGINLARELTVLFRRKQKDLVIRMLQLFDPTISGIEILQDNVYLSFDNVNEMMPINMVGDGLRRYLNIVSLAANPMNNIILIDEIDNGLHYSVYSKLWNTLLILAKEENKQFFISTHSKETLGELYKTLSKFPEHHSEFRLYSLEKTKLRGHQAYKYTFEGLKEASENNVELRGVVI